MARQLRRPALVADGRAGRLCGPMYSFVPITHDWALTSCAATAGFRGWRSSRRRAYRDPLTLAACLLHALSWPPGCLHLMRNLGGAIGIALCGTALNETNLQPPGGSSE